MSNETLSRIQRQRTWLQSVERFLPKGEASDTAPRARQDLPNESHRPPNVAEAALAGAHRASPSPIADRTNLPERHHTEELEDDDLITIRAKYGPALRAMRDWDQETWGGGAIGRVERLLTRDLKAQHGEPVRKLSDPEKRLLSTALEKMREAEGAARISEEAAREAERTRAAGALRPRPVAVEPKYVPLESLANDDEVRAQIGLVKKRMKAGEMISAADAKNIPHLMKEVEKNPQALRSVKILAELKVKWAAESLNRAKLAGEGGRWERMRVVGTQIAAATPLVLFILFSGVVPPAFAALVIPAAAGAGWGVKGTNRFIKNYGNPDSTTARLFTSWVGGVLAGTGAGLFAGWIASLFGAGAASQPSGREWQSFSPERWA